MGKYLSKNQTAEFFDVTVRTIDQWASQGIIKPRKIGGKVFFVKSELEELFNLENTITDE